MHIPDGFLSTPVWAALDTLSVPAVGLLANRARREMDESRIPLLGVMGAFVFAAQLVNFPVGLGTSGHLVGGALLACVLGPGAAALVMTAILAIQALVFQDGGIIALGANVLNMAVAGVIAGYLPYHWLGATRYRKLGIFAGAFLSVLVSAMLALSELLISGVKMPAALLALSTGLLAVNALLEGAITVSVVSAIERLHPNWIREPVPLRSSAFVLLAAAAILLAGAGWLVASGLPDGLERALGQGGELDSSWLRRALAGLGGVALIWLACLALGRIVARRRTV